jgi:hypothetical protein
VLSPAGIEHFLALLPPAGFVDVEGAGQMVAGDDDVLTGAVGKILAAP